MASCYGSYVLPYKLVDGSTEILPKVVPLRCMGPDKRPVYIGGQYYTPVIAFRVDSQLLHGIVQCLPYYRPVGLASSLFQVLIQNRVIQLHVSPIVGWLLRVPI